MKKRATILLSEDEEDITLFTKDRLLMEGYDVVTAVDGEEGLRRARELHPSLILLDVMLPKVNGYQICRELKKAPETSVIPVIMVTVKAKEGDKLFGKEMGADAYITKPYETDLLLKKMRDLLGEPV